MSLFLQIENKTLHQQKDYNLLYCYTGFVVVVWYPTNNILRYACTIFVSTLTRCTNGEAKRKEAMNNGNLLIFSLIMYLEIYKGEPQKPGIHL